MFYIVISMLCSVLVALLLKVTEGPANHACISLSAYKGKGAKLNWSNAWPYWSPRNFWECCVALDEVCRVVTSPAPGGDNTADLYCCVSPFFFPFDTHTIIVVSCLLFPLQIHLPNILCYVALRWTDRSCPLVNNIISLRDIRHKVWWLP